MQARDDADAGAAISRPRVHRRAVETAFALVALIALLPLNPGHVAWGLDPSWQQVLHVGFERGMQFGSDLIFTYGPWGFAHTRLYWPSLFPLTIFYWSLVALGTWFACVSIARHSQADPRIYWPPLLAGVLVTGIYSTNFASPDAAILFLTLLLVEYVHAARPSLAGFAGLCAILGFVGLGKLTNVVMGGAGLAAALAILALRRQWRLAAAGALAFTLAFLAGWLAAGQRMGTLVDFVANGMQIVTGYNEAMVKKGNAVEKVLFVLVALLALAPPLYRAARMRDAARLVAYGFCAVALALAYKQGFTRHDRFHAVTAFGFLVLAVPTLAMQLTASATRLDRGLSLASLIAAFAALLYALNAHLSHSPQLVTFRILDHFAISARTALDLATGSSDLRRRHEQALEAIRARTKLAPLDGTVDVYPYDQADVFALGMKWNPRPVFQSYSAYTPKLAALNAAHVAGPGAPDHLFFAVEPIDGRMAAFDDGASWIPILENYRLRGEGDWLLFDRSAAPRRTQHRLLARWHGAGWYELPQRTSRMQTAAIRLDARALSPVSLFAAPPRYWIEVRVNRLKLPIKFLFIPGAATEPFPLSPLVYNNADFAALANPCAAADPANDVRSIRIVDAAEVEVPYSIDLHAVDFIDHADPRTDPLYRS